ncbi:hypothetical protein OE88DRAFT_1730003 [Heliocybe sulcata]|uniref:DRBM domain-containing protein n=1 Tax=Heliocybe sulcata TaxID=5364 RepID=A0A5C3NJ65_9AGAM|nr:hypothetical protein OE88DRAFT_1730003 [Heliocybe sulcata]
MPVQHPTMHLNNFLQAHGGTQQMEMRQSEEGPNHERKWRVVVFINNIQYGTGLGHDLTAAKKAAAQETLTLISANGNRLLG